MRDAGLRGAILCREKRDHLRIDSKKIECENDLDVASFHFTLYSSVCRVKSLLLFLFSFFRSRSATDLPLRDNPLTKICKNYGEARDPRRGVPLFSSSKAIKSRRSFSRRAILFASFLSSFSSFFSASRAPFLGFFSRNEAASLAGRQPSYDTRLHQQTKSVKDIPLTGCLALSASGPFENDARLETMFVSQAHVISSRYLSKSPFPSFFFVSFLSSCTCSFSSRIVLFT